MDRFYPSDGALQLGYVTDSGVCRTVTIYRARRTAFALHGHLTITLRHSDTPTKAPGITVRRVQNPRPAQQQGPEIPKVPRDHRLGTARWISHPNPSPVPEQARFDPFRPNSELPGGTLIRHQGVTGLVVDLEAQIAPCLLPKDLQGCTRRHATGLAAS